MEFMNIDLSRNEKSSSKTHLPVQIPCENQAESQLLIPEARKSRTTHQGMLNKNLISYAMTSQFNDKRLIKPIAKKVHPRKHSAFSFKQSHFLGEMDPFQFESRHSFEVDKSSKNHFLNLKEDSQWNEKKKDYFQSPRTRFSPNANFSKLKSHNEKPKILSNRQSPNPFYFGVPPQSHDSALKNLTYLKKGQLMNQFMYHPQTNNNVNIFNLISDLQQKQLSKRNFNQFESFDFLQNSFLKGKFPNLDSGEFQKEEKVESDKKQNLTKEICGEDFQLTIKLKRSCLENCKYKEVKEHILKMANWMKSISHDCLELSFDNSAGKKQATSLKLSPKRKSGESESGMEVQSLQKDSSFPLIRNIVWNSFLRNEKNKMFRQQLETIMKKVINKLKNNDKLIYHKVNIFTLINLQIPLDNSKFHSLSAPVRLRVICMLFAKYVSRKPFSQLCSNFLTCIDLRNDSFVDKVLCGEESQCTSPEKVELLRFFSEDNFYKNESKLDYQLSILFLKKILIYTLTLMRLMNDFVEVKTGKSCSTNKYVESLVRSSRKNSQSSFTNKVKVDVSLLDSSVEQLINLFNIEDFNTYLVLGHTYIYKKNKRIRIKLYHRGELRELDLTCKEQRDILCCKTKRKDELIKFSFKFIRRQVFKKFKQNHKRRFEDTHKSKLKKIFYKKYLNGDEQAIKYFESFDLSRKGLETLKEFSELKKMMLMFQEDKYIAALTQDYIFEKTDEVLKEDISFQQFIKEVLSRQHKHSVVMQGIINSLEQFIEFFQV